MASSPKTAPKVPNVGQLRASRNIDDMVSALIEGAYDNDDSVRKTVCDSLVDIGRYEPGLVLSFAGNFLQVNPKLQKGHKVVLLQSMTKVVDIKRDAITDDLGVNLVALAIAEMTAEKDVVPDWQGAASELLVNLGRRWPAPVMSSLMNQFQPGAIPHYFTMKTMGDLASANGLAVVPLLKEVLARVLPVLGGIKHDNIKWVFASGMARFAEAILSYVANNSEDKTYTIDTFASEMFPPYEVMFSNWTKSSEKTVRLATMQAVGHMCALMSREQFESQVPKILPHILGMYKKEAPGDHLPITLAFVSVIEAGTRAGSHILEPYLIQVLPLLHGFICRPYAMDNSAAVKNHNEMLRCVEYLARVFIDQIVTFFLKAFESKEPKIREVTVEIFRHLVNRIDHQMSEKKELVVSGLQPLALTENNYQTRQTLLQLIVSMANHGYLLLEGGEPLVNFIVKNCSITDEEIEANKKQQAAQKKENADTGTSALELRNISDHVINLMTTTIAPMTKVLWPFLFEPLTKPEMAQSVAIVSKCLTHLAKTKKEDPDFLIDFDVQLNLPRPQQILARLLVLLNAPMRRGEIGKNILDLLESAAPILHPSVSEMWSKTIPKIVQFLGANKDNWNQTTWEDLVLRLLSETVKVIADDAWVLKVGEALVEQFPLYKRDPELKKSAYKHLGIILQLVSHKEFIRGKLDAMFNDCNHGDEKERQGCSQAFGFASHNHLDIVLEKLSVYAGPAKPAKEEGGGFFSSLFGSKDDAKPAPGGNAATIVLAYGYVTAYAKPTVITSRIDVTIMKALNTYTTTKSPALRETVVKTIELIGKAVTPQRLNMKYDLKQRDDLLKTLVTYMTPEKGAKTATISNQLRILCLNACGTLILLDPVLSNEAESALLDVAIQLYKLAPGKEASDDEKSVDTIHESLNKMLATILFKDSSLNRLRTLFGRLASVVGSENQDQRKRSMTTILFLLKKLVEFISEQDERKDTRFDKLGETMAVFLPRATDPEAPVRQMAIEAVQIILYLDHIVKLRAEHKDPPMDPPSNLAPFTDHKKRIVTTDLNEQFAIVHEMSALLADTVPIIELAALMTGLVRGLTDSQASSARGTCVLLYGLVSQRGKELTSDVQKLVQEMCAQMGGITNDSTLNGTLHALRQLAATHLTIVMDQLLALPLPHPPYLIKAFQVIALDTSLQGKILQYMTNALNIEEVVEARIVDKNKKTLDNFPTSKSLAVTVALGEIFQKEELRDFVTANYWLIFSTLMLRFGSASGFPEATDQTINTYKQFLVCVGEEATTQKLTEEKSFDQLKTQATQLQVIATITAILCKTRSSVMRDVYQFVYGYLKSHYHGQRLVGCTILGEFINYAKDDTDLLSKLVNAMLNCMIDVQVKIPALIGLSNIVSCTAEQMDLYATTVLDALLSHVEDPNEPIATAALNGLKRLLTYIDDKRVAPIMINLCHRMRPLLDRPSPNIRAASAGLLGALARFGDGPAATQYTEQCHALLPCLMMHIADEDPNVQLQCKTTMKLIAPFLRNAEVEKLFAGASWDPARQLNYDEFCNYVSKLLINAFPERLNSYIQVCVDPYFKSPWNVIKASAATLVGCLLGNLPKDKRVTLSLNPGPVSKALILLLRENNPRVRQKAAVAIAMLHTY